MTPARGSGSVSRVQLPSLLAGRLRAATTRKYSKGRDWYDLMWYLSQRAPVEPNVQLLQNALDQTHGVGKFDAQSWRAVVRDRLESFDMEAIWGDFRPFLERPQDVALMTLENLLGLLREGLSAVSAALGLPVLCAKPVPPPP